MTTLRKNHSAPSTARGVPPAVGRGTTARTTSPTFYSPAEFLDDQLRVLELCGRGIPGGQIRHTALDGGRLLRLHACVVDDIGAERVARLLPDVFSAKYGPVLGMRRAKRFLMVLRFAVDHTDVIENSGFGTHSALHEDLLRHLLNCDVQLRDRAIPTSTMSRFCDEWSHHSF